MEYPIVYIETEKQLDSLCKRLGQIKEFALDLEADVNLHRYGRKLCLAQIWDDEYCWLVDITAVEIKKLKQILEDPEITKIMYSASFDASLLHDLADISLDGLFDLQVCSSLLGWGRRSLKYFVKELFDIDLEKDLQTSDWFRRPLSSDQIKYASLDVRYLIEAKSMVIPKLEENGLVEAAWDESCKVAHSRFQEVKNPHLRVRNSAQLTPYQKIYLYEYFWVRDHIAQQLDLPTYRILRSYQLLQLSKYPPKKEENLQELSFFDEKLLPYVSEFMLAAERAKEKIMTKNALVEKEIVELRQLLHRHPELSGKEKLTVRRIHRLIRNFDPTRKLLNLSRSGIGYEFKGLSEGKRLLLRAKIDAVTGKELNDLPWASREGKVVHMHGNDGHTAILAGLASRIFSSEKKKGLVLMAFQPSSVNGKGAAKLVKDKRIQNQEFDYCLSMQNLPGYPQGSIILSSKAFFPASQGVILKIRSEKTLCLVENQQFALICGKIIHEVSHKFSKEDNYTRAAVTFVQMGKQNFLKSPQAAEIRLKLTSINDAGLEELSQNVLGYIHQLAIEHGLEFIHTFTDYFPAVNSSQTLNDIIKKAASKKQLEVIELQKPLMIPDDFGYYAKLAPLAVWGMGIGENAPELGSARYDFPDDMILTGIEFWEALLEELEVL